MDQAIINWIIGLGGTVIGIFIKSILDSIKDLQRSDKEISERVGSIEVLVAGTYVKRDELRELMRKLEQIDAKLDRKANKDECGVRHQPLLPALSFNRSCRSPRRVFRHSSPR